MAQASQFVGIQLVPRVLVFRVASQSAIFKGFSCDSIHGGHGPVAGKSSGEPSLVRLSRVDIHLLGEPLWDSLRSCAFSDRLVAQRNGLIWYWRVPWPWRGSTRLCAVGYWFFCIVFC